MTKIRVNNSNVTYTEDSVKSNYVYQTTKVEKTEDDTISVTPVDVKMQFETKLKVPKTGVMFVGLGGNNGSTIYAACLANKQGTTWKTKKGVQKPNYFGSITQASTIRMGVTKDLKEIYVPLKDMVPMVSPNDLVIGGWDCSSMNLGDAMERAKVLEVELQQQLYAQMKEVTPLPAIFDLNFVAMNQESRADHIIKGTKQEAVDEVRKNIRDFKAANGLDTVIILWTANTERWCNVTQGVHDTADNLLAALAAGGEKAAEISPSTCYAIASILEGCAFINGAPQNTNVPGLIDLARRNKVFVGGDDFKSGQTKMKSALIEFFVAAGIKPECIASYNHLGNNDGYNLNSPMQFRSKEITKSNVVDDMVASNQILFPEGTSKPDHCIVIKYLPYVGDSKRALDEYTFSIFMGGEQVIVMHNTCQDSLLAAPLMLDLVILTELMQRVTMSEGEGEGEKHQMDTVLSILSYMLKAPLVPTGTPIVNALNRQKQAIENLLRAMIGLPADNSLMLECRVKNMLTL